MRGPDGPRASIGPLFLALVNVLWFGEKKYVMPSFWGAKDSLLRSFHGFKVSCSIWSEQSHRIGPQSKHTAPIFSVCMYLHSLTQPCDVNNFWSLPYNTVQKCAKCSSIYILSGYKVWLCSDLKDESCVQTSNPPQYAYMGFLGGQANLCAHFGWAYVADYNWWIQNILHPSWGHKPKLNATTAMKFHYKTQQLQARNQNLLL